VESPAELFELTRALVDIESITKNEKAVADFIFERLSALASSTGGQVERMNVAPARYNVFAWWGSPTVTLSTHMDTVPPHVPAREDEDSIWGRGACDAKGILASMVMAVKKLLAEGARNFALLFLVGEERNSAGARAAAKSPRGSRFLINGEPTGNRMALGSKGALRFEITARGRLAHSAYPELGSSAIEKLLDVLQDVRRIPLPRDPVLGPATLNIGTISGGRAPNVVADLAQSEIMLRTVCDSAPLREAVTSVVAGRAEVREILRTPAVRLGSLDGFPTTVVSYTTDIPILGDGWGRPFLIGPGSIHVAHTAEERIAKRELLEAVEIYAGIVKRLLAAG
jgi:acetylornithine deacetylase